MSEIGESPLAPDKKVASISGAFTALGEGLKRGISSKTAEYATRIINGAKPEEVFQGLPPAWKNEVDLIIKQTREFITKPEAMQLVGEEIPLTNSSERKIYEYAQKIIEGQKAEQVLQGLPPVWTTMVKKYIDVIIRTQQKLREQQSQQLGK